MSTFLFDSCNSLEDVKKRFRELIKEYHPDNGGNAAAAASILEQYKETLKKFDAWNASRTATASATDFNGTTSATDLADDIADAAAIACGLDGTTVELCGSWLWVTGNTYVYRSTLKAAGFKWASKKKAWYFHAGEYRRYNRSDMSLSAIRAKYGAATISVEAHPLLT